MRAPADKRPGAGRFDSLRRRQHWLRHLPWVVLAASLAGSWQLWRNAERNAWQERKVEFDLRVREAAAQVRQRLGESEQLLYGVRGFLSSQRRPNYRGFSQYMHSLEVPRVLPAIEAVSYAPLVRAHGLPAHIAAMRREGFRAYRVYPQPGAGPAAPLAYIAPQTAQNRRLQGYDVYADPLRRQALERARDTGQPVISDALVRSPDGGNRRDERIMLLAVYRTGAAQATLAERRANIRGWVAVSFRVGELTSGLFPGNPRELDLELLDSGRSLQSSEPLDTVHDVRHPHPPRSGFAERKTIQVGGLTWVLRAASLPAFDAAMDRSKARLTALSAILLSIALTLLTAYLVRARGRALRFAEGVNSELERNRAVQEMLQESERRWKLALEAVGDGVWDWDLTTNRMTYSPQFEEMLGYAPGELERDYEMAIQRIHPDDRERANREFMDYLRGSNAIYASERRVLCKDGTWKWMLARGMAMDRGPDGRYRRMIGTHTDISRRRAMEQALRDARRISDDIINSLPGVFYVVDAHRRMVRWNRNMERATGYTRDEMSRMRPADFFAPEDFPAIEQIITQVFTAGAGETEALLQLKNGDKVPYQFTARRTAIAGQHYMVGVGMDISARRAAEAAVRDNDERYRAIFSSAQDFIFTVDTENRLTSVTDYFCETMGYGLAEVLGTPVDKFFTTESMVQVRKMIALKVDGRAPVTRYEANMVTRQGRLIPVEINSALIFRDGKVHGSQGIARDITERRRHEEALRESEEKYRGLFESAGDYAYSTDLEGNFVATSESLLHATGFKRGELRSITQILSAGQLALAREMTAAKMTGGRQTTRYELEITTRDGMRLQWEIVSTLEYRQGRPVGVQGIGRDMAERKRAEELLRRSERNYRELMEQAAEAIFVADHDASHYVDVNRAACDMLGYTREELIGTAFTSILHPEEIAEQPIKYADMWSGQVVHTRRRFRRKDGSFVPVELSARMLSDGRLQALGRDISTWIEREDALQQSNLRVEAASRAKSEFLANMSHEIRTPMNSVIGMARLALARETEARQIGYLEKILMSGEHLLGIIDDILDFSKIEAGKVRIERTGFDLRAVLDSLKNLMADKAIAKGLELAVEVDPDLSPKFQGDPLRLRQVLLNFVDNAIKFTSRGRVTVRARGGSADQTGAIVCFEVVDTGIGLSEVELAMLFRPFQQSDGSVTRKYGGTGLGLSISKRLVELMGGEAGVESAPGRGSRFWFRLRLDQNRQEGFDMPEQFTDPREMQAAIRSARILLAENNVLNQQVAREFLEIAGCTVHVAANGYEVLDLLRREPFDCILMDIQMPLLDGLEATRQIRADPAFAAIPVIAVTANALDEERQRCLAAGMNDFVTKPLRPETLYAVLAKWLSRQTLPLSLPDKPPRAAPARPSAAIDFAVLSELVGGNPEKMRQMAHKFLKSAQEDMEKVRFALAQADVRTLKEMGHHIKSPAAMVGAGHLAGLCQALESNPHDLEVARELVGQMQGTLAEIEDEIKIQFP